MATYQELLADVYKKKKWALSQTAEKKIANIYSYTLKELADELERTNGDLRKQFLKSRMANLYDELKAATKDSVTQSAQLAVDYHAELMNRIGYVAGVKTDFSYLFKGIPMETIIAMEKGKLYSDGLGLSKRLWGYAKKNGDDIEEILKSGMLQGTDARKLAGILTNYIDPTAAKPWPKSRVKELLGYTPKNTIDYNAMRLARTSISHAYSLTNRLSVDKNPFVDGFIWHSAFAHERTCEICSERDGQHYTAKDLPYDHPNGLCWEEPFIKGSITDISKEIGDWARGGENKRLDSWWKKSGGQDGLPKVTSKPPKATPADKAKPVDKKPTKERLSNISKVTKKYNQLAGNAIEEKLKNSPDFIVDWFEKGQKYLRVDNHRAEEGAWYSPFTQGITINFQKDLNNPKGKGVTFFHEFGHLLDDQLRQRINKNGEVVPIREAPRGTTSRKPSADPSFIRGIYQDYEDMLNSPLFKGKPRPFIEGKLTELLRAEGDLSSGVQDIYSGLTLNKVRPKWGHDTDYWTRGDRGKEIASEAFAHMTSDFTDPERLAVMKKWFPSACDAFEKIITNL